MFKRPHLLVLLLIVSFAVNARTFSAKHQKRPAIEQKSSAKPPTPASPNGIPVIVNRDTLFKFYANQGLFNAKERASIVSNRIGGIISRVDFNPDSLILKNDSAISVIMYKSELVLALNNKDASYSELDRPQLAASYLAILKKNLGNVYENNNIRQIIINITEAAAVIALLLALIWTVNRAFRWIKYKSLKSWESRIAKLGEKGAPIGYIRRLLPVFTNLIRIARLFIIVLLIYLALPIAFSIFPSTKSIAADLLGYVINPVKDLLFAIVHFIPNLLTITVIYLVTRYVIKLIRFIAGEIENGAYTIKNFYPEWAIPTYNIIKVLLYAFMFVVIYPYLPGSQSDVFKGVTVFLGILFSFGSSSAISNMVAGIMLTYMRPFKIGDRVKVGDVTGDITEKNLLVTRIRTIKNEDITVPNASILAGAVINYSSAAQQPGLILHTSITIGFDAPWHIVHELLINAALATEGLLKDPKPFVLQTGLNDFNVTYQVNAYTSKPNEMAQIYSKLNQHIQDKFNEAGIEIMSPHFTSLRDGNSVQIPDNYKSAGYQKPGFKVEKDS